MQFKIDDTAVPCTYLECAELMRLQAPRQQNVTVKCLLEAGARIIESQSADLKTLARYSKRLEGRITGGDLGFILAVSLWSYYAGRLSPIGSALFFASATSNLLTTAVWFLASRAIGDRALALFDKACLPKPKLEPEVIREHHTPKGESGTKPKWRAPMNTTLLKFLALLLAAIGIIIFAVVFASYARADEWVTPTPNGGYIDNGPNGTTWYNPNPNGGYTVMGPNGTTWINPTPGGGYTIQGPSIPFVPPVKTQPDPQ